VSVFGTRGTPLYVRVLRLKQLRPGGVMCALLFEGVIVLAVLLSLAQLVNWWSVLVLPVTVAAVVKINDMVASAFARSDITMRFTTRKRPGSAARGSAQVPSSRSPRDPRLDAPTEIIPRTIRRRSTNQRRFASPARGRTPDTAQDPQTPGDRVPNQADHLPGHDDGPDDVHAGPAHAGPAYGDRPVGDHASGRPDRLPSQFDGPLSSPVERLPKRAGRRRAHGDHGPNSVDGRGSHAAG